MAAGNLQLHAICEGLAALVALVRTLPDVRALVLGEQRGLLAGGLRAPGVTRAVKRGGPEGGGASGNARPHLLHSKGSYPAAGGGAS